MLNESTELVTIDEQADHEIVHGRRFGKANGATHEPLDPCPQIDMFALDFLCIFLANVVLLGGDMPLVSPPPIRPYKSGGSQKASAALAAAERPHPSNLPA